mgnify:CR=1 FL=1
MSIPMAPSSEIFIDDILKKSLIFKEKRLDERSRKLDEKLRKFRLYQNIRDAIGGRYYRK